MVVQEPLWLLKFLLWLHMVPPALIQPVLKCCPFPPTHHPHNLLTSLALLASKYLLCFVLFLHSKTTGPHWVSQYYCTIHHLVVEERENAKLAFCIRVCGKGKQRGKEQRYSRINSRATAGNSHNIQFISFQSCIPVFNVVSWMGQIFLGFQQCSILHCKKGNGCQRKSSAV